MYALHAEVATLWFGLRYAFDAGFRRLEEEVDNMVVVELLNSSSTERPCIQVLVNDMIDFAKNSDFGSFNFRKISYNKVAHAMANVSLTYEEDLIWME